MSLSQPTAGPAANAPWEAPLAPMPSALARVRSRALRAVASRAFPRSVLFADKVRDAGHRRVALTFDDGPDSMTRSYLDALGRLGVRATFFLVGENAARAPELVAEYVRRGHEVGGHGWSHEPFSSMSGPGLADELARTAAMLPRGEVGRRALVRPPRGALSVRSLLQVALSGYTTVLWSVDSDDCRTRDPRIVEQRLAPSRLSPGDVVLLHEMQPWTLEALPAVVGALRHDGWDLVTVSELME